MCVHVCIHMYTYVSVCEREYVHFCGSVSVRVQGSVHACMCCVTVCTQVCGRVDTHVRACTFRYTRVTRQHRRSSLGNQGADRPGVDSSPASPYPPAALGLRMVCACGDAAGTPEA